MEIIHVTSHQDFIEKLNGHKQAFLLIYKKGSSTSDCAFNNISKTNVSDVAVFAADVNKVRDIHPKYNITTAPTLLQFTNGKFVRAVKGCNSPQYYQSLFDNTIYSQTENSEQNKKQPRVILYTTPSCPWCRRLKQYLKMLKIKYHDIDVSKNPKIAEELVRRTGQTGVPQAEINGKMVVGFDKPKIDKLLGIK